MLVRSPWLKVIKGKCSQLRVHFFTVDLAPSILKFLLRDEGGCFNELIMGVNCTLHSALLVCVSTIIVTGCERHIVRGAYQPTVRRGRD